MPDMMPLGSSTPGRYPGTVEATRRGFDTVDSEVRYVVQLVRRQWPIPLFAVMISLTVAVYHLATRVPTHESTSRLLIIEQGAHAPSFGGGTAPTAKDSLLDPVPTHIEIIRSPLVTRRAAERLGLPQERANAIADSLRVVQADGSTRIVRLNFRSLNRDQAVSTLEAVIASYEEYLKHRYESKNKQLASLLSRAKDEIQRDLATLETSYLELRQSQIKSGLVVDGEGRPVVSGRVAEWVRGVNQALHRSVQLESQLELGRELHRQGFGRTAILRAMELIGGSARAETPGGEVAADDTYHRLATELEEVELERQTAQRLVDRLEANLRAGADQVDPDEVEQILSEDAELARLRTTMKAARDKANASRRVTRNSVDPSLTVARARLSELWSEFNRVRAEKAQVIRQRLAREQSREEEAALRGARSELVALEVRRATLGERIEAHRAEQARRLAGERDRLQQELGAEDPMVKELREHVADLTGREGDAGSDAERDKVRDLFRSLNQARRANVAMQAKLEERLKGDLEEAKRAELEMLRESNLRNNVERQRALFNTVVDQLKEVRLADDTTSVTAEVVEPAHLVGGKSPVAIALGLAVVLGAGLGLGLALLREVLDTRVRTCDQLRAVLDFPMLGHIPLAAPSKGIEKGQMGIVCLAWPRSLIAESFKSIRTNLDSCRRHRAVQVILVTSPQPGDGKSTAASNLAISFAQAGRSVLLIDADLRRPTLHDIHGLSGDHGLVHALKQLLPLKHIVQPTAVEGLVLVAAGPEIPDPAEALSSPQFDELLEAARREYDVVIIDSPPLLAVTDPCIISVLVDGIVLVVRPGALRVQDGARVNELLRSLETPVLGTVVNGFTAAQTGFSEGYGYIYGYGEARRSSSLATRTAAARRSLEMTDRGSSGGAPDPFESQSVTVAAQDPPAQPEIGLTRRSEPDGRTRRSDRGG